MSITNYNIAVQTDEPRKSNDSPVLLGTTSDKTNASNNDNDNTSASPSSSIKDLVEELVSKIEQACTNAPMKDNVKNPNIKGELFPDVQRPYVVKGDRDHAKTDENRFSDYKCISL